VDLVRRKWGLEGFGVLEMSQSQLSVCARVYLVLSGERRAGALCVWGWCARKIIQGSTLEVLVAVAVEAVCRESCQELGVEGFYNCEREVRLLAERVREPMSE
jgi:hypothetical protein